MTNIIINENSYSFVNFTELNHSEIELVWKWRNNNSIRKWMFDQDFISFENHLKFIKKLSEKKDKLYFLAKREQIPVGVFSIVDIKGKTGEWGYYIAPEYHDHNLGVEFYYYGLQFIFEKLNFEKIVGYALIKNKAANSLNDLFGFTKTFMELTKDNTTESYYYRELSSNEWIENIKPNKKIGRLLELTINKQIQT